jgi:parallel beta-helix repeat protein
MDGMGSTEFAFHGDSRDVTIEGLVIEHYANPPQRGAIDGGGVGWTVTGNEIRNNLGAGVVLDSNFTIADNFIHHNEQIGVLARGSGGRLVDNEISFNNPNDRYDPAWEAGGTKFILTNDLYVSGNYVHDNHGPGLWTDHQNSGTLYEDNVVSDNYGPGIMHEVSYDAVIRDNQVTGNAYEFYVGGILVSSSPNVLVYDNMVVDNNGGIAAVQDDRGSGNSGVFELTDLNVSENRVSYETGWGGVRVNNGADVTKWGIVFSNNSYSFSPLSSRPFFWGDERLSLEQWRAIGFDDPNGP